MTEPSFERTAATSATSLLLLCDHASNAVPAAYGGLGLDPRLFATHIAYDIGAAIVTRTLAQAYGAAALLGGFSPAAGRSQPGGGRSHFGDEIVGRQHHSGNRNADAAEVARRIEKFHAPYHAAISAEVRRIGSPTIISMHSFTPAWKGQKRPWDVGVLWDRDARLAGR